MSKSSKIHQFDSSEIESIDLPEAFTFPFYYSPHRIAIFAARQLQQEILSRGIVGHNFGLDPQNLKNSIGKMFGVLVVKDEQGKLGFLAGFSGKLASSNHHSDFVPPVYDLLDPSGFFLKEEEIINEINRKIESKESDPKVSRFYLEHEKLVSKANLIISEFKADVIKRKKLRRSARKIAVETMSKSDYEVLHEKHKLESLQQQFQLRELQEYWASEIDKSDQNLQSILEPIIQLKKERKERSAALQKRIFLEYSFFDCNQNSKSLNEIFHKEMDVVPPSGAGECAAPKMLHYAFKNNLIPIAMAEFWWGESPKSKIRKHKNYYPACRSKCEPILKHMLSDTKMDPNPLLENAVDFKLDVIYEDSALIVINKPPEVLSVPGKTIEMSVLYKLRLAFPEATGPLLIHRLDMSTSGILIAAKNKEFHKDLQAQFMGRSVEKTYIAVLDGIVQNRNGVIDLPLRVDLDNRPHQLVCHEHGKRAVTKYNVVEIRDGRTRIEFSPITGRTHQLRVHAAHSKGLGCPIWGDDLYGIKRDRLHLHAEQLKLIHPETKEPMVFKVEAPF